MNIQEEVQKIHNQYSMTEKANYKIQLLCEQYAKDYHNKEMEALNSKGKFYSNDEIMQLKNECYNDGFEDGFLNY